VRTLTVGQDNSSTTFSGVIQGGLNLTKVGSGTLTLAAASTYTGTTTVSAGTLAQGIANAYPPSPCIVAAGATFDLNGFNDTIAALSGAGNVNLGNGTLTVGNSTSTTFSGSVSGAGGLTKTGTGTLTLAGPNSYAGPTAINGGTLRVAADQALPSAAQVTVALGATLDFNAGTHLLSANGSITGTGRVTFSAGMTAIDGAYDLTDSPDGTDVAGGSVRFDSAPASLGINLTITAGVFDSSSASVQQVCMLTLTTPGVLTGSDTIIVTCLMVWTGGTMAGTGTTQIGDGVNPALLDIHGADPKFLDTRTLDNQPNSNISWMGSGGIWVSGQAPVINEAGAVFNIANDQTMLGNGSGNGSFNNQGTLNKTSAVAGTTTIQDVAFSNNGGKVNVLSGTFRVTGDYTQTSGDTVLSGGAVLAAGGTVNLLGGTLSGSGRVTGNVDNSGGQVNPGGVGTVGTLTIIGNYTQEANGTLNIDIQDAGQGDFDQLLISGIASLGGTINVNVLGTVNPGDSFQILTFTSHNGDFASPPPGFGEFFDTNDHWLALVS
jgi:autotransporter-associated beta strand protein